MIFCVSGLRTTRWPEPGLRNPAGTPQSAQSNAFVDW